MDLLCLEFLNTRYTLTHAPFREVLGDPEWLAGFLNRWNLNLAGPFEAADGQRLLDLRVLCFEILDALEGAEGLTPEQIKRLNQILALSPLYYELDRQDGIYVARLNSQQGSLEHVLYAIAASFVELITQGEAGRIKRCQNPACGWVYYDESKNGSRKWCGNTCASLMKVRAFRQRKSKD